VTVHLVGLAGLVVVFLAGSLRPVNLGALALAMAFLVGTAVAGESAASAVAGFPVDLLVLLAGVTYLFGVAAANGTVAWVVDSTTRLVAGRRAWIPWGVFVLAALPAMAGALGSAGVALLAPFSLRLAERHAIDPRLIGLMVVHGAAAGNFSPLNVLGAVVHQGLARSGLSMSSTTLFLANVAYNVALGVVIVMVFGGRRPREGDGAPAEAVPRAAGLTVDQALTLIALVGVAVAALGFGLAIGPAALAAAVGLHLAFPGSAAGADRRIAWDVVLLVCGIVTYVAALQRHGTVEAVGHGIAALGNPLLGGLLVCALAAVTSAFASSAGILAAMIPLAVPLMMTTAAGGGLDATGLTVALALSATTVDATPFSTVGALVVGSAADADRPRVYRGLLLWGASMVVTTPLLTWLLFVVPTR
jgi:di/tricarboxylate transporter